MSLTWTNGRWDPDFIKKLNENHLAQCIDVNVLMSMASMPVDDAIFCVNCYIKEVAWVDDVNSYLQDRINEIQLQYNADVMYDPLLDESFLFDP